MLNVKTFETQLDMPHLIIKVENVFPKTENLEALHEPKEPAVSSNSNFGSRKNIYLAFVESIALIMFRQNAPTQLTF